jgi:hypothetical protein
MKLYMSLDNILVIPYMLEKVPNFKAFIELYLWSGAHRLFGHTKAQQFWLYMHEDDIPDMQYKL